MDIRQLEDEDRIIAYYVDGNIDSKDILLFLNGLYVGNRSWIKQQRHNYFRKNYKMIFFDYPGAGESIEKSNESFDFDDIVKVIKRILDIEKCNKCNLISYSIGGMIGLWFIYNFPSYVEKLILLNTGADIDKGIEERIYEVVLGIEKNEDLHNIFKTIYPLNHSDDYLEKVKDMEDQTVNTYVKYSVNKNALATLLKSIKYRPNIRATLEKINVPTLIIGADKDKIFPNKYQEALIKNIKNNKHYVINDCGHAAFIEKYKLVNSLIEKHLEE